MKTFLTAVAITTILSAGTVVYAGDMTQKGPAAREEIPKAGLQPLSPGEVQEQLGKRELQNLQEQQRTEKPALEYRSVEAAPYTKTPQIGGQDKSGPVSFLRPTFPFFTGELLNIEGQIYTVRDPEGQEVRVHVDKRTAMEEPFHIGDMIEVHRTLRGHALSIQKASAPMVGRSSSSSGTGLRSRARIVPDKQVTLGGAEPVVRGEVLAVEGNHYLVRDGQGNLHRFDVNQNTRLYCGSQSGSMASLLPDPIATDMPRPQGQPEDRAFTASQKGSEVGPGTRSTPVFDCGFKAGDQIEAEVSDMGRATFIQVTGRPQPGEPLP
jgi:hypothetical protein